MKIRFDIKKIYLENEITRLAVNDIQYTNIQVEGVDYSYTNEGGIILVNIPQDCPTETNIKISLVFKPHEVPNSYDAGYDNGYQTERYPTSEITYENTFTFYGFDETVKLLLRQPNEGYNNAYSFGYRRYRSITAQYSIVHKPFTDEYHYYDTSGHIDVPVYYNYYESIDQDKTSYKYSTRNTMFRHCANDEVTFIKRRFDPGRSHCGCNSTSILSYEEIEEYSYQLPYLKTDWLNSFDTVVTDTLKCNLLENCTNTYENTALVYIDYDLKKRYIDDKEVYALAKDVVEMHLIDCNGNVLDEQTTTVTDFDNYIPIRFDFTVPSVGAYVIRTIISSYDRCDEIVRSISDVQTIHVKEELVVTTIDCKTKINNCSLDEKYIDIYELVDVVTKSNNLAEDKWELIETKVIPKYESVELELEDGIYKIIDVERDKSYLFYHLCKLTNCLLDMTKRINCGDCTIDKEYIALGVHMTTLLAKTYKYTGWFRLEELETVEKLGNIKDIIERAHEYCEYTECKSC